MTIFIKQKDAMDCGNTCLSMIARFYGIQLNGDSHFCTNYLGKSGVSLLGISKAAEAIGFKSIGGKIDFDTLAQEALLPCIAHWNQNHFVVIYKIKNSSFAS